MNKKEEFLRDVELLKWSPYIQFLETELSIFTWILLVMVRP